MPRKLRVFQTSVGFFDLAVAAPSMKAAAEAWGSDTDIFRQGYAKETDDADVVKATMASPGVVLRRPVGSQEAVSLNPSLPKLAAGSKASGRAGSREPPDTAGRDLEAEPQAKRADQARKKAEAERERARKQRERIIAKAEAALKRARGRHEDAIRSIEHRRAELAEDEARENDKWQSDQQAHKDALNAIEE